MRQGVQTHGRQIVSPATAVFGAPVVMGAEVYSISLRSERLDEPLVFASPRLLDATLEQAERMLATVGTPDEFIDRVRRCVIECTRTAEPTLERVARELSMSPRSLQRKLKRSGTAFHKLRDETRLALARRQKTRPRVGGQETRLDAFPVFPMHP